MSKYIKSIPLSSIERMAIVLGNGRLAGKVKADTGADIVCNAGFYNGNKATHNLQADGVVLGDDGWTRNGYAWDVGGDIKMEVVPAKRRSYIGAVELLTPMVGIKDNIPYDPKGELGGKRGRTAMALGVGKLILLCTGDGTADAITPETLRDELYKLGAETALMLDGGGSSQCDFGGGQAIYSSRKVHNYLCIWLKKGGETVDKKTVVLDPGHGVETAGKRSPDGTYFEHEFNLDMANRVKAILERHGIGVTMTRSTAKDVSLERRVKVANGIAGLNLFVSLHSNASGDGWTSPDGYGIYTSMAGATAGRNIAANKLLARAKEAGIKLWGSGLFHDGLYVLKNTVAPAILIEHGFHTNRAEVELLKSSTYRDKLAEVDAKGILDYLGVPWQDEKPTPAPWYDKAQKWAVDAGISDGTRPEENVTRAEAWAMLQRLAER
jgi:N-acetylmuramoyl-L-alanine amidase